MIKWRNRTWRHFLTWRKICRQRQRKAGGPESKWSLWPKADSCKLELFLHIHWGPCHVHSQTVIDLFARRTKLHWPENWRKCDACRNHFILLSAWYSVIWFSFFTSNKAFHFQWCAVYSSAHNCCTSSSFLSELWHLCQFKLHWYDLFISWSLRLCVQLSTVFTTSC